ncbi:hypothetical protein HK405_001276, partial [Cladochytrium tenue]
LFMQGPPVQPQLMYQQQALMLPQYRGQIPFGMNGDYDVDDVGVGEDDDDDYIDTDSDAMDDDLRENTRFNAIVDANVIEALAGPDLDAPLPRVAHGRNVIFRMSVEQIQAVPVASPEGAEEWDPEATAEYEEEYEPDEDDPPTPTIDVITKGRLKEEASMEPVPVTVQERGSSLLLSSAGAPPTLPALSAVSTQLDSGPSDDTATAAD